MLVHVNSRTYIRITDATVGIALSDDEEIAKVLIFTDNDGL